LSSFFLKQGDTAPAIDYIVLDEDGVPINLTGSTVTFYMQDMSGNEVIDGGACSLIDAPNGQVRYQWLDGDSDISGLYAAEFLVTFGGGTKRTTPDPGWITVVISSSLRAD
jgi:BppU N-terminal domain